MKLLGIKPKNHVREQIAYIRKLEEQNQLEREEKDAPKPLDAFKMKKFANVKSKLAIMWDKENDYLERRGYVSPSKNYQSSENDQLNLLKSEVGD